LVPGPFWLPTVNPCAPHKADPCADLQPRRRQSAWSDLRASDLVGVVSGALSCDITKVKR